MFDFNDLGIKPGDVISIFAEAIDTAPEANLARSQTINLTVISEEDYNAFLRERNDISDIEGKYSELLDQFHSLVIRRPMHHAPISFSHFLTTINRELTRGNSAPPEPHASSRP